ncbi:hypothetical protein PT287_07730 [Lactobacillus sp. ESL0679]|uniref:hypothetical protein n=1 Tax=Lactobacillus sp. ESL0679 TaxID=2983209 RepID=UPI0023F6A5AB|nr:hypothetical protein [Lactobacillus sp. ESL0679]MDF7683390.1 hypothetical protein [Lactobacillus sp. ESL0679]
MTRTKIPWDQLHYLEDRYDNNLDEVEKSGNADDIRKLNEIILIMNPDSKSADSIARYIEIGYGVREVEEELKVDYRKISAVMKERRLELKPKFSYMLVDPYGCPFFLEQLENLKPFGKVRENFKADQRAFSKLGFKLYRFDNHWFDLDRGDNYMVKGNNETIFVK